MIVSNITKTFANKDVLKNISIRFEERCVHGLLGANGAGKSTLIKALMGLVFVDNGSIEDVGNIAMLAENPYLPINLTAYEIVSFTCAIQSSSEAVESLLQEVRLKKESWHKPVRTYSKGMKQRTAIAAALAGTPQWLILDEPMSGLDAMGRKQMLDVFERRKEEGVSILMCSHAITDLVRLCDKVHILADGVVRESVSILRHDMQEVENLEQRLVFWSGEHVVD